MRAFIDTSTLVKKYVQEPGSDTLEKLLSQIDEVIVAPIYLLELASSIHQKCKRNEMKSKQATWLFTEAKKDLLHFAMVNWNDNLVAEACRIIQRHGIRTLDSIQLSSGILSRADLFLTSDKTLYQAARRELRHSRLII